jgi:hypothetical protein
MEVLAFSLLVTRTTASSPSLNRRVGPGTLPLMAITLSLRPGTICLCWRSTTRS